MSSDRIRRVDAKLGIIQTVVQFSNEDVNYPQPPKEYKSYSGYPYSPNELTRNLSGNLLFLDPVNGRMFQVDVNSWTIKKIAGVARTHSSAGDGESASSAWLENPSGLAIDREGNIYVSDYTGNRVRRIDAKTGIIRTIAGNGLPKRSFFGATRDIPPMPHLMNNEYVDTHYLSPKRL
jgi:sugar lactone lactonase YvrE